MKQKQRILWAFSIPVVIMIFVFWFIRSSDSSTNVECNEYSIYPSPDGRYILLFNMQTGSVLLYARDGGKVQTWDAHYQIPHVGNSFWSHDSQRFLLVSEEEAALLVVDVKTGASRYRKVPNASLKALLSGDGKRVVMEVDEGLLIWHIDDDRVDEVRLSLEQLIELGTITWVDSQTLLLKFGARNPKLATYNLEEKRFSEVPLQLSGVISSLPYGISGKRVPILVSTGDVHWIGMLDLKGHTVQRVLSLPPSLGERGDWWLFAPWNSDPRFLILFRFRYLEQQRKREVVRVDLIAGEVVANISLDTPFVGIDASGRVWGCQQGHLVQIAHLANSQ